MSKIIFLNKVFQSLKNKVILQAFGIFILIPQELKHFKYTSLDFSYFKKSISAKFFFNRGGGILLYTG